MLAFVLHRCQSRSQFGQLFDPSYFERLDPGELESLVHLVNTAEKGLLCLLCSSDEIVFKVLGRLHRSDQGISLEEVLQVIGLGRKLPPQYTRSFREACTRKGSIDAVAVLACQRTTHKGCFDLYLCLTPPVFCGSRPLV